MKAILNRYYEPKQTRGVFTMYDNNDLPIISFMTLELPWLGNQRKISCIPEGVYTVEEFDGNIYKDVWEIKNVPGRTAILMHWANFVGSLNPNTDRPDLQGCVAMGDYLKDITNDGIVEILDSKKQIASFRLIAPKSFKLYIQKA